MWTNKTPCHLLGSMGRLSWHIDWQFCWARLTLVIKAMDFDLWFRVIDVWDTNILMITHWRRSSKSGWMDNITHVVAPWPYFWPPIWQYLQSGRTPTSVWCHESKMRGQKEWKVWREGTKGSFEEKWLLERWVGRFWSWNEGIYVKSLMPQLKGAQNDHSEGMCYGKCTNYIGMYVICIFWRTHTYHEWLATLVRNASQLFWS